MLTSDGMLIILGLEGAVTVGDVLELLDGSGCGLLQNHGQSS